MCHLSKFPDDQITLQTYPHYWIPVWLTLLHNMSYIQWQISTENIHTHGWHNRGTGDYSPPYYSKWWGWAPPSAQMSYKIILGVSKLIFSSQNEVNSLTTMDEYFLQMTCYLYQKLFWGQPRNRTDWWFTYTDNKKWTLKPQWSKPSKEPFGLITEHT